MGNVRYTANGDCVDAPVTLDVNVPEDYAYMEFEFHSSYDGATTWPDEIYDSGEWSGEYNRSFAICPSYDSPGTYNAWVDVTFYDYDWNEITTTHASDAFTVSPAHTTTLSTNKIKTGAHGWTIRTNVKYDGHASAGHKVTLQRKYSGAWHYVKSVWTNAYGNAPLSVTPPRGAAKPYRAVSAAGTGVGARVSPTYWLKRR